MQLLRDCSYRSIAFPMLAVLLGCGGSDATAPNMTPTLTVQAGADQSVTVGQATSVSPSVMVADSHGGHPAGIPVTFTPDSDAGSTATRSTTTDRSGIASAGRWTTGTTAKVQHLTASATVDGVMVKAVLAVTALPDRPAAIRIVSGDSQDGPYGATLVTPFHILVTDRYGNPTPGVTVHFGVDTGAVTSATATTGPDGTASTHVRLPQTLGSVILSVATDSTPGVTSTFTSRGVRFASFSMDANTTCGLSVEGYPYCWGDNAAGELVPIGVPAGQNAYTPRAVSADLDLTSVSLADIGGCGLRTDGSAVCWGSNVYGANGNGNVSLQLEPMTPVAGNLAFAELQRGPVATCGSTKSGQSYCWGASGVGQVGAAGTYRSSAVKPTLIDGGTTFHSYALGQLHSCALDPVGQAYCWGMDLQGRLGVPAASAICTASVISSTGTTSVPTTCSPSPVAVNTPVRFTSLVAASNATCGLTATGATYCWGSNDFGELGTGGSVPDTVPAQVAGVPPFKQLSAHDRGFCGLTSAGDIYCWGYVGSVLGVPSQNCPTSSDCTPHPAKVQTGRQFSSIAFTTGQLCGLSNGIAYCWGTNYHGALGTGASDDLSVSVPTRVADQSP